MTDVVVTAKVKTTAVVPLENLDTAHIITAHICESRLNRKRRQGKPRRRDTAMIMLLTGL